MKTEKHPVSETSSSFTEFRIIHKIQEASDSEYLICFLLAISVLNDKALEFG
jgi:hypothetical protein